VHTVSNVYSSLGLTVLPLVNDGGLDLYDAPTNSTFSAGQAQPNLPDIFYRPFTSVRNDVLNALAPLLLLLRNEDTETKQRR
jgi:hypothetical protein